MADPAAHLRTVGRIVRGLRALASEPVLVGGMALVVLGSRRVTRDFDFVVGHPGDRLESPASAYFFSVATGLRIDLLFDFPRPAADLATKATRLTIRGQSLLVASEEDLLHLKRTAAAARSVAGDAEDIAFLESRQRDRRPS
jgi:hypothetical protein